MKTNDTKKINWSTCIDCKGLGRILRGPSKKRRRLFQIEMDRVKENGNTNSDQKTLIGNMDVCFTCTGSGLLESKTVTEVDKNNYPKVAIIGGGIGGVALAVACLHRGNPLYTL